MSVKERLKTKLMVDQMYKKLHTQDAREKIVKELYFEAVEKRLMKDETDYMYEGQRIPFTAFMCDMLYQFLRKDKNIQSIEINMRNGKTVYLSIEE